MEPIPVSGGQGEKIGEALWVMPGIGDYEGEEEFLLNEGGGDHRKLSHCTAA